MGDAISALPLDVGLAKGLSAGFPKTGVKVSFHGGVIGVAKTGVGEIYKEFLRTPFMRAYLKAQSLLKEISPDLAGHFKRLVQIAKQRGVSLEEVVKNPTRYVLKGEKVAGELSLKTGFNSEVGATIVEDAIPAPARKITTEATTQSSPKKLIAHDVVESTAAKTEANLYKGIKFNTEVVNIEILQEAEVLFKDVPGANNLIKTVEKCGYVDASPGNWGTAKGAMFELEGGVELSKQGETIVAFGKKLRGSTSAAEFDIVTPDKVFECKNITWKYSTEETLNKLKSQIGREAKTARDCGMDYGIIFKGEVLPEIKEWLIDNNFNYLEI